MEGGGVTRAWRATLLAFSASLACASPAAGHSFYVDGSVVVGDCLTPQTPCKTIGQAMSASDPDVGSPDSIVVRPGTYEENVELGVVTAEIPLGDRSLVASNTSAPADFVIKPDVAADPTVEVSGAVSIAGFTIEGPNPMVINGPGRVLLNRFTGTAVPANDPSVRLEPGAGGATVDHNTFEDGTGTQVGLRAATAGMPSVHGNSFTGFSRAIEVTTGAPVVTGNAVSGGTIGIQIQNTGSVQLASNLVTAAQTGLVVDNSSVTAANLTSFDNSAADIALDNAASLTLNSSVVEAPIAAGPGSTCAISFSAGPTSGAGCDGFLISSANPGFAGVGDYHLAPGSPLIDAGDPLPPNGLDLDGDTRVAPGSCGGAAVRDIGADEFVLDCPASPPATTDDPSPIVTPPSPPADTDPPETMIGRAKVAARNVALRFSSDEPGSSFLCKLDRGPFRACESPTRYRRLERGAHVFRVKAVDAARNEDPVPARKRFRIR
jgi:hypothetical protein